MSKNSFSDVANTQTYVIYENLAQKGSGYLQTINTNLNNLCTRCILQSIQTSPLIRNGTLNKNNFIMQTKGDNLTIQLVRMNAINGLVYNTGAVNTNIIKQVNISGESSISNATYDLGYLLAAANNLAYSNSFINFTLTPIRGFGYNSAVAGATLDTSKAMFAINVQPDNYALVQVLKSTTIGGTKGALLSDSNVLFSKETVVKTKYTDDFSFEFNNASLAYQYLNTTSPTLTSNQFVQIGSFVHNGYGQVQFIIKNFTSNYETPLESTSIPATGNLGLFGDATKPAWQVEGASSADVLKTVPVRYDTLAAGGIGKYYFNLDEGISNVPLDRVYFRGTGPQDLPYVLNNKNTLLLYTGRKPVVINSLDVNNGKLDEVITGASKFKWVPSTINGATDQNIFQSLANTGLTAVPTSNLRDQSYTIILTNESAANAGLNIYFRSAKYTLQTSFFGEYNALTNPNKIFLGAYATASELFQRLRLTVTRESGINSTWGPLISTMIPPLENPQNSDDKIIQNAIDGVKFTDTAGVRLINSGSAAFRISDAIHQDLFTISVNGILKEYKSGDGQGFQVNILPSSLTVYTAMDLNRNGELDVTVASNTSNTINNVANTFGLQTMFSELSFKLPLQPTQYMEPAVVGTWALDRGFKSVPGAPFDIKLNNLFAVGYNLDCFFTIQNSAAAQFDIIAITTKANTKPDGTVLSSLVANAATTPLIIANANEWARSITYADTVSTDPTGAYNYGSRSGLTFKLKSGINNVAAGDVVRLYVDNTIAQNNLEWRVSVANTAAKTYQLYSYDQERYATLLDEQLNLNNKFSNEA